jgi:hypothetical protein
MASGSHNWKSRKKYSHNKNRAKAQDRKAEQARSGLTSLIHSIGKMLRRSSKHHHSHA